MTRITALCEAVHSFQATVEMAASVGSVYKNQITDFKKIKAFVLYRKPNDIRIIGLAPVIGTKVFDMVSNGKTFKVFDSPDNRFFIGQNNAPPVSKNPLENLRPEAFLSAMLICPPDPETHAAVLQDQTDEEGAFYVLNLIRTKPEILPSASVWFDRIDLQVIRQLGFEASGAINSDSRYSKWTSYAGVQFPGHIEINRPQDGYGMTMDIQEMKMNVELTDDKFVLNPPEGAQIRTIDGVNPGEAK